MKIGCRWTSEEEEEYEEIEFNYICEKYGLNYDLFKAELSYECENVKDFSSDLDYFKNEVPEELKESRFAILNEKFENLYIDKFNEYDMILYHHVQNEFMNLYGEV